MVQRLLSIFVLVCAGFLVPERDCYSQNLIPDVTIYSSKNGLSQIGVSTILKDSHGFLWIGTQDGLNVYDGTGFSIYQHDPEDSTSIVSNFIKFLREDTYGNIWIGTINGLCMFDRSREIFINFVRELGKDDANILALIVDHEGIIWIKTYSSLISYDPAKRQFTRKIFRSKLTINPDLQQLSMLEDKKENLWIGTKEGLYLYNRRISNFSKFTHVKNDIQSISSDLVKVIFEDSEGLLWIGTDNGLNLFDPNKGVFSPYYLSTLNATYSNTVNSIVEGEDRSLWIGTDDAFYQFIKATGQFKRYNKVSYDNDVYDIQMITSMSMDRSGILWIGFLNGLIKYDTKLKKFPFYRKNADNIPPFSSNDIASIFEDDNGLIWIGTWGYGLNIFDRKTNKVLHYSAHERDPKFHISDNNVHVIFRDSKGKVYLGTENGIDVYNKANGTFMPFCTQTNAVSCTFLRQNRIYCMLEDHNENLWIGTMSGLHKYDAKYSVFQNYYSLGSDNKEYTLNTIYSLLEDRLGYIWIGTDNGLVKFNPAENRFYTYYMPISPLENGLSSNSIYSLYEDSRGILWIGTSSGLNKYNPVTDSFKIYTVHNGLPNNVIYKIIEDRSHQLWMSTNKGLTRFDPTSGKFVNFDLSDGIQNYEFNIGAYYKSSSGEIFFGGISGFNAFYPDTIRFNNHIPPIAISSFEMITPKGKEKIPVYGKSEITVPYNSRSFTITFAALDFTDPGRNNYNYKLVHEGSEAPWIEAGNRHFASYDDLAPGTYVFMVKGSNNDQVWNEEGTSLRIIIETPLWRTTGAIIFYIIVIGLMIFFFVQYRTRSLRSANKILKERQSAAIRIARQSRELAFKNKNITDSLNYAKRIQEALMPSEKTFKKILPDSFVFHKPKDIVSGDFYWINESNNRIYVAAVDCTGHGVPGAFMSIIGFELFRKITYSSEKQNPDKILDILNNDFADIFKDVDNMSLRDGMDIALCLIDKESNTLSFAGAFNPLYIIRDNKILDVKGDRFSVSLEDSDEKHQGFSNHEIPLMEKDVIYLFSDGFADQFGGHEGKKFKYRRFRHVLLNIHSLPMVEQKSLLEQTIDNWRGPMEQVDDILVIGFRL